MENCYKFRIVLGIVNTGKMWPIVAAFISPKGGELSSWGVPADTVLTAHNLPRHPSSNFGKVQAKCEQNWELYWISCVCVCVCVCLCVCVCVSVCLCVGMCVCFYLILFSVVTFRISSNPPTPRVSISPRFFCYWGVMNRSSPNNKRTAKKSTPVPYPNIELASSELFSMGEKRLHHSPRPHTENEASREKWCSASVPTPPPKKKKKRHSPICLWVHIQDYNLESYDNFLIIFIITVFERYIVSWEPEGHYQ